MEFDAGTWWLIGILLTFLIGALGWMVKRSLDKIERKLDSAATKAELEKEVGECKQQISEIQHTYTTRSQHQQDWTECHNDIKACLLYTSPSPRDGLLSRMPSSA